MRRLSIILAIILAVIVAAALYLLNWVRQPTIVRVPIAIDFIPAGAVIDDSQFRLVEMANVDRETLNNWVTVERFPQVRGKQLKSDVQPGFPLARVQVDVTSEGLDERRLSLAITNTNEFYMVVPVGPDQIGNFVQPGDYIDLILTIGSGTQGRDFSVAVTPTLAPGQQPPPPPPADALAATRRITLTSQTPVSKLTIQNLKILRVDRAAPPNNANNATGPRPLGVVQRLYVVVTRDQLEVLSFILNNGVRNFAVRAARGEKVNSPTEGVTWDDFLRWFYSQRGNTTEGTPFESIAPYSPTVKQR
jgi:Flp pilus assembly protein CpaB